MFCCSAYLYCVSTSGASVSRNINCIRMEYDACASGSLKLKGVAYSGIKKKKKKKEKMKLLEQAPKVTEPEREEKPKTEIKRTNAEMAFLQMQEKMQKERIKQKASMTHKQRVEEFNRHLDTLTEHFDIPKVSWTK